MITLANLIANLIEIVPILKKCLQYQLICLLFWVNFDDFNTCDDIMNIFQIFCWLGFGPLGSQFVNFTAQSIFAAWRNYFLNQIYPFTIFTNTFIELLLFFFSPHWSQSLAIFSKYCSEIFIRSIFCYFLFQNFNFAIDLVPIVSLHDIV